MKKIFLTSATVFGIAGFLGTANANIAADAESAGCNDDTIGATSGNTTLEAQWNPNEISITWYNQGEEITLDPSSEAGTCTYDRAITLPSNVLAREGYTFNGWEAKAPHDLASLLQYVGINGGAQYFVRRNQSTQAPECRYGEGGQNTVHTISCDNPLMSGLEMSEWKIDFSYGTVKGIGRCSTVGSGYSFGQSGEPTDDWRQSGAKYCWCSVTAFAEPNDILRPVSGSVWVFNSDSGNMDICADQCSSGCTSNAHRLSSFRTALFGGTAQ